MPKRIADTSPNEQIKEYIGSGPFVFKVDEWKPGDKTVYLKFGKYKPRAEPPYTPPHPGAQAAPRPRAAWVR